MKGLCENGVRYIETVTICRQTQGIIYFRGFPDVTQRHYKHKGKLRVVLWNSTMGSIGESFVTSKLEWTLFHTTQLTTIIDTKVSHLRTTGNEKWTGTSRVPGSSRYFLF